jgi:DNA-binding CsgD family transcriptional regulator
MAVAVDAQLFSSLLLDLYRCAREVSADQYQDAVLKQLESLVPFDSSMWGCGTYHGRNVDVHSIHLREQPSEMPARWMEVSHEDSVVTKVVGQPDRVFNINTSALFAGRPNKAGILEHARRYGAANGLVAAHSHATTPLLSWISLYREDGDAHFSERERQLFQALFPHVMEALTINRRLHLDALYAGAQGGGIAIVDSRGTLHHCDGSFEQTLRAEWSWWGGRNLPQPLLEALMAGVGGYRGANIAVKSEKVGDLLFLKARLLGCVDRLTRRERQIAESFASGQRYKEIAKALGLAPATVRNHLQAIYGKLEVGSKAAMAALLAKGG